MIGKEVKEEKAVPVSDVRNILEKRKDEDELTYEQKISLEYAQQFGKSGPRKTKKALDELVALGFDTKISVKIIDVKPTTKEELKLIFEKVRSRLSEDQVKKILAVVAGLD